MLYERDESILHPVSGHERHTKTETLSYPEDLDFDCLSDPQWLRDNRVTIERCRDTESPAYGLPDYLEIKFPWHHDFTQTVIVRYTRIA